VRQVSSGQQDSQTHCRGSRERPIRVVIMRGDATVPPFSRFPLKYGWYREVRKLARRDEQALIPFRASTRSYVGFTAGNTDLDLRSASGRTPKL
jgi:hypothetical protein